MPPKAQQRVGSPQRDHGVLIPSAVDASMRILCPSISNEIELPACAEVVAISSAART
jgi:hypothetical protein